MEVVVALKLCIDLHDGDCGVYIDQIVSKDDNTLHSHLMYEEQGGILLLHISPLKVITNHSHQIKVIPDHVFSLTKIKGNNPAKCEKKDISR